MKLLDSGLKNIQQDDRNDWKELTDRKGMLFTIGLVGNDPDAINVLTPQYGIESLTVAEFAHNKVKELTIDNGTGSVKLQYMHTLSIITNQIQIRPRPNFQKGEKKM